ncbi:MAG: SdrD B-like domain-containing protein, partial [Candidatus Methylumidiphilus sp.]
MILAPLSALGNPRQPLLTPVLAAKLGDTVWEDANANGQQDNSEVGIQGITVNLWRDLNNSGTKDANEQLATTTTDSLGQYVFKGLAPGFDYQVEFVKPTGASFTTANAAADDVDSDVNAATGLTGIVNLTPGQYNNTLDAGFLPYGSISGTALKDADNSGGFSAGDTPLAGAVIGLYKADGTTPVLDSNGVPITTTVDGTGHYLFTGLPFGDYVVKETNPNGYSDVTDIDGNGNGPNFIAVSLVSATPHVDTRDFLDNVTIVVNEIGSVSGFVYVDADNDGVFDSGETPISGTTITLTYVNGSGVTVSQTQTTNEYGYYEFSGLSARTYTLTEGATPGYADGKDTAGTINGVTSGTAGNDVISGIVLNSGEASVENNFGELLPSSISGYVFEVDADKNEIPISGASVVLTGTDDLGNPVNIPATTDADGFYQFTGLRPGNYTVTETTPAGYLDSEDFPGTVVPGVVNNDQFADIQLGAGVDSEFNNFSEVKPATLSGYVYEDDSNDGVKDGGEAPIAGVTLTLLDASGNPVLVSGNPVTTVTDANGYYEFTGLLPGAYGVAETQPTYLDGKDTIGSLGGSAADDLLTGIVLNAGDNSTDNNFGEL